MGEGALWARGEARARRAGPASEDGSVDVTRPAAIWLCDGRGTLVLLTGAGVPWSGAVEVGAAVEALVPGPSRPRMSSTVRAALDGTPGGFEVVHGGVRWVVRVEPSRDGASGTITRAPESDIHREMVERAPLCVHRIGRDGAFASINQAGVEMLGLADASEALGRPYLQGVDEADLPRLRELMDRAFAGHGSHFELRAGGRVFESCFVPLPDADGQVESIFGLSQDVTERKRTEIELGRSEERYRLLVERSPYCIHQIDQRGCLTSMNAAGLRMMGVEDEAEVRGMPYLDSVCARDQPRIAQLLAAAYDGVPSQFEFEAANGQSFASTFVPVVDDDGGVSKLIGLTHDVTLRTESAKALADSEHRLAMTLRAADLGLWVWDTVADVMSGSRRTAEILGEAGDEIQMSQAELMSRIHPEDRDAVTARARAHLAGETDQFESEYRLRTKDGEWRWLRDRGRVMERDEAGEPVRMFGITQDVTERVRAEAKQQELHAQLVQAQKMESVGQLAGGIAHDFNNLLTVILGNLEMALEDVQEAGLETADLEETRAAAERASSLTRRLLTFSRQRSLEKSATDLNAIVEGLGGMLERVLPDSITLELSLDPTLPPIDADAGQIEQVLLNLSVNARDAMPGDGTLRIETRSRDGMAELTVRDDGAGMSEETRRRALEPFFTTKEPQGGTGLGLAMVYGIVTQHGGELLLDSALGRGTRVVMCFPALREGSVQPPPPSSEEALGRGTVLVIEDESHVRKLVCRTLVRAGYEVLEAADGVEGVALFEAHADEIDLVIVDAIMPRMDGREATKRILALRPDTRLLFSTGYHAGGFGDLVDQHRLLSKPYTPRVLLDTVTQVLDAASATP